MADLLEDSDRDNTARQDAYAARTQALRVRVAAAAKALVDQGVRPTVTRIRAALGGGSPNELAPALKHWKDLVLPTLGAEVRGASEVAVGRAPPPQIADLTHELWQRALAAAAVEIRGGPTARQVAVRTEEANSLRNQLNGLRDQLQRESLAYGELRAQAARHETIARQALARVQESEARERDLLRKLGEARQRIVQLEAAAAARPPKRSPAITRLRKQRRVRSSKGSPRVRSGKKPKRKPTLRKNSGRASVARASLTRRTKRPR